MIKDDWKQLRKDMKEGYLSKAEKKLITKLENEYSEMKTELDMYKSIQTDMGGKGSFINWLKGLFKTPPSNADYWNNKWSRSPITYRARGYGGKRYLMDIRSTILNKSYILNPKVRGLTDDSKALELLKYVRDNLRYVSDSHNYNEVEYWQHPEITIQKGTGDCEDGSILLASLMRIAGIPAYKVKVCAGWVKTRTGRGGHAYVIYLADDGEWYPLDWCYHGIESVNNFKVIPHKENDRYEEIWFTFNDKWTWAQNNTKIN